MTWKLPYLIPFLFSLVVTSKVSFDYNAIASSRTIGMVCIVKDREESSLIKIQQGAIEKVTMTSDCIIKSNDTRLTISCIEAGNDVMLSLNLTYPGSSDMGNWNCSDGKSYDTVTFADFIKDVRRGFQPSETTFNCIVHEDCNLSMPLRMLPLNSRRMDLRTMDGKKLLTFGYLEQPVILDVEWRRKIVITDNITYPYLTFMLRDVDISNAGIYYYVVDDGFRRISSAAFIIKITDYPERPTILLRNNKAESYLSPYELHCVSESKSQPMFTRKKLSFNWRLNGHNLTELQPLFRLSGPILTLCMDVCLEADENTSVTCTAEEDGLVSNESQPFIVSVSRVISKKSARCIDTHDDGAEQDTGILVGAVLGSFLFGAILSVSLKYLVAKRGGICKKEHRQDERYTEVPNNRIYVNSVMMRYTMPEDEVSFRPTHEDNENTYEAI